uniref:Uncharacterized protein n=1 Tax=Octopus bimaculoides TaxID=37653 RepID=A0A0L8GI78_OCTBM
MSYVTAVCEKKKKTSAVQIKIILLTFKTDLKKKKEKKKALIYNVGDMSML